MIKRINTFLFLLVTLSSLAQNEISFKVKINGEPKLTRYANRLDTDRIGTFLRNTYISISDLERAVKIINRQDVFRAQLNEHYKPGESLTGIKLKKRPQKLMNKLDPLVPVEEDDSVYTLGYKSNALISFSGLRVNDTIIVYYNTGRHSKRIKRMFVIKAEDITSYGNANITVPLGHDDRTSTYLGVQLIFGPNNKQTRHDQGHASYSIEIERSFQLPGSPSTKPISKNRARKRVR